MTREEVLDGARTCVCEDRNKEYGTPEDSFEIIAGFWSAYLGFELEALDVAVMMALLKIGRIANGSRSDDNFVDLAGYAACGGEIAERIRQRRAARTMEKGESQ